MIMPEVQWFKYMLYYSKVVECSGESTVSCQKLTFLSTEIFAHLNLIFSGAFYLKEDSGSSIFASYPTFKFLWLFCHFQVTFIYVALYTIQLVGFKAALTQLISTFIYKALSKPLEWTKVLSIGRLINTLKYIQTLITLKQDTRESNNKSLTVLRPNQTPKA